MMGPDAGDVCAETEPKKLLAAEHGQGTFYWCDYCRLFMPKPFIGVANNRYTYKRFCDLTCKKKYEENGCKPKNGFQEGMCEDFASCQM